MKPVLYAILAFGLVAHPVMADNLGVYGEVFPIAEPDLLKTIHAKLEEMQQDGEMAAMQKKMTETVIKHVLRPPAVAGISTASAPRTWYYDPTFVVTQNIIAPNGVMIVRAGTRVNPLAIEHFDEVLLFINADDASQVDWAKAESMKFPVTKIILVEGNIKDASKKLGRIYFDQDGVITKKLGITEVPAMVQADGLKLRIDEVPSTQIINDGATLQ